MRLTPEQTQRVVSRLNQISMPPRPCSVCGNPNWNVADIIFEVREFHEGNVVIGGDSRIIPFISMSCQNCGNTVFLNAIQMGIVDPNQRPQNNEGSNNG